VDDGRGIHSASAAQKLCALQQAHVRLRVEAILAARSSGRNQSKDFPGAENRRRDADEARDIADA
jgi:hypothetical protein